MTLPDHNATFLTDWQSAELAAVAHMQSLGFIDAQKTQAGADGGIDVESSDAAAQVKFYANPVGRPDVQRLRGAAHEYRVSVFYSTGGYTKEAVQYADSAGVALFLMDTVGSATAHSQFARVLSEPEQVQERRERLEELKADRYAFAAGSFKQDLSFYDQFIRRIPLEEPERSIYSHVASELDQAVTDFEDSVLEHRFDVADALFEEINKRMGVLAWITGSELRDAYKDLEEAIAEGWRLDSTPGSGFLLQRAALGAHDLKSLAQESLKDWKDLLPSPDEADNLNDEELRRAIGMLAAVAYDPALLPADLLAQLKSSVRSGVQRIQSTADSLLETVFNQVVNMGFGHVRPFCAWRVRLEALARTVIRQLDAS